MTRPTISSLATLCRAADELGGAGVGQGGVDEVGAAAEDAGALGAAHALAAAEDHHVRAVAQVALEVGTWGQHGRGVHDDRHVVGVGDLADLGQGHDPLAGEWRAQIGDGGGALVDRPFQLPGMVEQVIADLDDLCAGGAVGVVVGEAVHRLHDDLVLHAIGVGETLHPDRVVAGDAGRRL